MARGIPKAMANSLESKTRIVDLYRLFGHACQRRRCFRTHADDEFRRETADYMISAGRPITQCRPDWASTRKPSAMDPGPPPRESKLIRRAETPADYFATFDCFDDIKITE